MRDRAHGVDELTERRAFGLDLGARVRVRGLARLPLLVDETAQGLEVAAGLIRGRRGRRGGLVRGRRGRRGGSPDLGRGVARHEQGGAQETQNQSTHGSSEPKHTHHR